MQSEYYVKFNEQPVFVKWHFSSAANLTAAVLACPLSLGLRKVPRFKPHIKANENLKLLTLQEISVHLCYKTPLSSNFFSLFTIVRIVFEVKEDFELPIGIDKFDR